MLNRTVRLGIIGSSLWLALSAVASAQYFDAGQSLGQSSRGIQGTGTVVLQETPTVIRMSLQLSEKAETVEKALEQLKDRREAAVQQLEALGAVKEAVKVEPPVLSTGKTSQQQRTDQMIKMLKAQGRRVPKGLEKAPPVTVTANLTAEWPLKAASPEEAITLVKKLQDKVEAADLAGTKEAKKLTPEEEEVNEEMKDMMESMSYGGGEEANPGEPTFFYVATLSPEAQEKAIAEAFAQAKGNAEKLAKAAGIGVGPLASLTAAVSQSENYSAMSDYYGGGYPSQMMMARQLSQINAGDPRTQALSVSPTTAKFQVIVMVTFDPKQ
jgi:uncharacterized protein YggE